MFFFWWGISRNPKVCDHVCMISSGQCGSSRNLLKEMQTADSPKDLLHGSEYVLTYEDKDGDWMLVGDVPWE